MTETEFEELENELFVKQLGLEEEQVKEASNNLLDAFATLYSINERLKKEGNPAAI